MYFVANIEIFAISLCYLVGFETSDLSFLSLFAFGSVYYLCYYCAVHNKTGGSL